MKIAIASQGNSLRNKLGNRLGRCAYIVIYDSDNQQVEIMPNASNTMREGAGMSVARLLVDKGVEKVISREIGFKAKSLLDQHRIQMIVYDQDKTTVQDIINMLENKNKLT